LSRSQGICAAYVGANLPSTLALGSERFDKALAGIRRSYGPVPNIPKGSHYLTGASGRHFPNGTVRPSKGYIVVVKPPDPPRALAAGLTEDGKCVRLTWQPPISCQEVVGYVVYRRAAAQPLTRLTPEPVELCEYVDKTPPPREVKTNYLVRAIEYSGLYGAWSGSAWIDRSKPGVDLLDSYDVAGSVYVTPGEPITRDRRTVRVHIPAGGDYVLWGRARARMGPETVQVSVDGKPLADARIEGTTWRWTRLAPCRLTAGEHVIELAREETWNVTKDNQLKNPGFEEGLSGWELDKTIASVERGGHSGKQCLKLSGNLTDKPVTQTIAFEVKPDSVCRFSYWMRGRLTKGRRARYGGQHSLGMFAAELAGYLPFAQPWLVFGGQWHETEWRQFEHWAFSAPQEPGTPTTKCVRVQALCLHRMWGESEGTMWIDDLEFHDLGPRLRPVKVTKLLVTNVPGYAPKGFDGREAYPFPKAELIAVTGLRQAGRTPHSITLAWNAARGGTRGYNVYINEGSDCPTTKYFRSTSVWGKTSVTIEGLKQATPYTTKVTAINEDGLDGPAESLRAITAREEPERD